MTFLDNIKQVWDIRRLDAKVSRISHLLYGHLSNAKVSYSNKQSQQVKIAFCEPLSET